MDVRAAKKCRRNKRESRTKARKEHQEQEACWFPVGALHHFERAPPDFFFAKLCADDVFSFRFVDS
jgi:hypothetical protein